MDDAKLQKMRYVATDEEHADHNDTLIKFCFIIDVFCWFSFRAFHRRSCEYIFSCNNNDELTGTMEANMRAFFFHHNNCHHAS